MTLDCHAPDNDSTMRRDRCRAHGHTHTHDRRGEESGETDLVVTVLLKMQSNITFLLCMQTRSPFFVQTLFTFNSADYNPLCLTTGTALDLSAPRPIPQTPHSFKLSKRRPPFLITSTSIVGKSSAAHG